MVATWWCTAECVGQPVVPHIGALECILYLVWVNRQRPYQVIKVNNYVVLRKENQISMLLALSG